MSEMNKEALRKLLLTTISLLAMAGFGYIIIASYVH